MPVWRPDDVLTRKLAALCEGRRKAVNTRTGLGQEIKAQLKASFPFALELLKGDRQSLLAAAKEALAVSSSSSRAKGKEALSWALISWPRRYAC